MSISVQDNKLDRLAIRYKINKYIYLSTYLPNIKYKLHTFLKVECNNPTPHGQDVEDHRLQKASPGDKLGFLVPFNITGCDHPF